MEIATTSVFQAIYPSFVLHKHWEMPEGFNDRLHALAAEDAEAIAEQLGRKRRPVAE